MVCLHCRSPGLRTCSAGRSDDSKHAPEKAEAEFRRERKIMCVGGRALAVCRGARESDSCGRYRSEFRHLYRAPSAAHTAATRQPLRQLLRQSPCTQVPLHTSPFIQKSLYTSLFIHYVRLPRSDCLRARAVRGLAQRAVGQAPFHRTHTRPLENTYTASPWAFRFGSSCFFNYTTIPTAMLPSVH